jgi:hypothetical protein
MTHTIQFASPWYVAGLRKVAALTATIADRLDRALQAPPPAEHRDVGEHHDLILARAAEESLANTRHRLSRYY